MLLRPMVDCDRERFPVFYDHSPNIMQLRDKSAKPLKRARDKEKDYSDGFKRYVSEVRGEFKLLLVLAVGLHIGLTVLLDGRAVDGALIGSIVAPVCAYLLFESWKQVFTDRSTESLVQSLGDAFGAEGASLATAAAAAGFALAASLMLGCAVVGAGLVGATAAALAWCGGLTLVEVMKVVRVGEPAVSILESVHID
jgi:hypothetical protein